MSVTFRSKPYRIIGHGIGETTRSGRRVAAMITGGAAALALILATAIPAKAEPNDLTKALIAAGWSVTSAVIGWKAKNPVARHSAKHHADQPAARSAKDSGFLDPQMIEECQRIAGFLIHGIAVSTGPVAGPTTPIIHPNQSDRGKVREKIVKVGHAARQAGKAQKRQSLTLIAIGEHGTIRGAESGFGHRVHPFAARWHGAQAGGRVAMVSQELIKGWQGEGGIPDQAS